jgi:hypothetical protein
LRFELYDSSDRLIMSPGIVGNTWSAAKFLTNGIYKIRCFFEESAARACTPCFEAHSECEATFNYQANFAWKLQIAPSNSLTSKLQAFANNVTNCNYLRPIPSSDSMLNPVFTPQPNKPMLFSAWVREACTGSGAMPCMPTNYANGTITIGGVPMKAQGPVIEGWQRVEGVFSLSSASNITMANIGSVPLYVDDIRIHPYNANMKSYVYDPRTLRLVAELDENNYAAFYEYDEEGQLVRVKKETVQGVKTIKETRSAKQKAIEDVQ